MGVYNFLNNIIYFSNSISEEQKIIFNIIVYTLLILIYCILVWKFYGFLASRDIMQLNLNQYNYSEHPALEKVAAVILYIIEYLVILPFLIVFWFSIFSILLLVLSKSQNTLQILLISAAIIASIRITSYINEDLSKDIAKILPFTVLAQLILIYDLIDFNTILSKIIEIPNLFSNIIIFIIFIFVVEFIFRISYLIYDFTSLKK